MNKAKPTVKLPIIGKSRMLEPMYLFTNNTDSSTTRGTK